MGNKIQRKLNSSTGATRGLLRFASDKNPAKVEWKTANKVSIHAVWQTFLAPTFVGTLNQTHLKRRT